MRRHCANFAHPKAHPKSAFLDEQKAVASALREEPKYSLPEDGLKECATEIQHRITWV